MYGEAYDFGGGGVEGVNEMNVGVNGGSRDGFGVIGYSDNYAGTGGWSLSGIGVYGFSGESGGFISSREDILHGIGVYGVGFVTGVSGESNSGIGVYGFSDSEFGVYGLSSSGHGLHGYSEDGIGMYGLTGGHSQNSYAAYLDGRVYIRGPLEKPGGSFKIGHPLDPANKYLSHSFVESPDMKNVYDGVVVLDKKGEAEIQLPDWFSALNKDFRYQLTAIGAPGPNLYIAEEIISDTSTTSNNSSRYDDDGNGDNNKGNRFKIAGGTSGMKVSWQVTGIRKDPWANANRIQVEEDKPNKEKGYYIYPDLYGQLEDMGISSLLFPEQKRKMQELLTSEVKRNL